MTSRATLARLREVLARELETITRVMQARRDAGN